MNTYNDSDSFWSYGIEWLLLMNLPGEVLYNIVAQVPVEDSLSLSRTCKKDTLLLNITNVCGSFL